MALTDKNIVITPNIGQSADPSIVFSGADAATTAQNITVRVYPTNNGTLSFEGTQGQLFSINNNFTGTIFSVNDISGIPSIEVLDTGEIKLAQYSGVVRVLSSTSATSTSSGALQVSGGVGIAGNTYVGGNLTVSGLITGNVSLTGNISTATNLSGGSAGQLHYQSAPGVTAFAGPGTAGQILVSAGASAPVYTNTGSIYVGNALISNNILGGTAGQLHYQSGANATSFVGPGTAGQILVSAGASAPVYTNTGSIYVGNALISNNILGGTAGQLHYQSAPNVTGYVGPGVAGQVLVSNGTSAPAYQNTLTLAGITAATSTNTGALVVAGGVGVGGSLYVGGTLFASVSGSITSATNIAAGTAGQIPYQTAPGLTSFIATATNVGGVLVNNGGAAPTFNNVLTLLGTTAATSTLTGALQVRGGVGIGGNLYVGGSIFAANLTGSISTATNLAGGSAGNIPIQTAAGVTSFITNGTAGQVLVSSGTGAAWGSYTAPVSSISTTATNLANGTANQIPYQSGVGLTTFSANFTYNGTNFTVGSGNATANAFIPAGSTVPTNGLYLPAANSVALATNSTARLTVSSTGTVISAGDVRINSTLVSSSTATGALVVAGGVGVAGNLWVGGTIYGANLGAVSTATHLAVGTTNQIPYQSALGRTTWSANFTYNGTDLTIGSGKVNAYSFVPTSSALPANGLYLPAVNSVGLATNSTARLTIDASGNSSFTGNVTVPSLATSQGIVDANSGLRVLHPGGGSIAGTASSVTGAIKIKFPPAAFNSSTMLRFTVKIYEYAGGSAGTSRTLEIGGYNYGGGNWYNFFATQQTMGGGDIEVRFGQDATSDCVWVGTTATVWSYPQVFVTDVQAGHSNYTQAAWANGWVVSFVTAFDTVEQGPIVAGKPLNTQNYNNYAPTLTGVGATGTWNINVGSAVNTTNATNATNATYVNSVDGTRNAGDKLPTTTPQKVRFDFSSASSAGTGGNYAGVMTYAPWLGTTGSTGDASYQLAFGSTAVNGGGVPQLNIRKGIDSTWNSWYQIHHDGVANMYATSSFRAPIFYDSDNTAYYVDGASTTYLNVIGAATRFYTGYDSGVTNSMSCSNWFRSNGTTGWYNASYDGGIYMTDTTWVRVYNNKQFYSQNFIQSDASVRAPIFYDSNDTNYYLDPASTSNLNSLNIVDGNLELYKSQTIDMSNTGVYNTGTYYPVTIGLPTGGLWIQIQNNLNSNVPAWSTHPSGFSLNLRWWSNGSGWGTTEIKRRVEQYHERFASTTICGGITQMSNSSTEVVWLRGGGTYYFRFSRNVSAAPQSGTYTVNSQSVAPTATAQNTVWNSASGAHTSYNNSVYADTRMDSPIFYDANDTGYYCDPNSTSQLNYLLTRRIKFIGEGGDSGIPGNEPYAIYQEGGSWTNPYPDLRIAFHTGIKLGANPNYNGIRFYSDYDMATQVMSVNNASDALGASNVYVNNSLQAGSSLRAPIFYDSNDTNYYLDPNSTSRLNNMYLLGGIASPSLTAYYYDAAIEVREYSFGGVQTDSWAYAPRIGFHWGGRVASQVAMGSNGWLQIINNPGNANESFQAANIYATGNVTAYYSDIRLKTIVGKIENAVEAVKSIETFKYVNNEIAKENGFDSDEVQVGLSAQSVEKFMPEVVKHAPFDFKIVDKDVTSKSGEWYKTVQYDRLVPLLIEAIKEQQQQIDDLRQQIANK